jgi:hypothetical protein
LRTASQSRIDLIPMSYAPQHVFSFAATNR